MYKKLLSLLLALSSLCSFAGTPQWRINHDSSISWKVEPGQLPHSDHIEMSGEQMAFVLRWKLDGSGALKTERSLVFPMLRLRPNQTHDSYMQRLATDVISLLSVDGLSLKNENTEQVEIDGTFRAKSTYCIGKHNIGSGKGTTPVPTVEIERIVFPSVDKALMCEKYTMRNISGRDLSVFIPSFSQKFHTLPGKAVDDQIFTIQAEIIGDGSFILKKGDSLDFALAVQAYSSVQQALEEIDVEEELQLRRDLVRELTEEKLVFHSPDPVINSMFSFAKLRTSESICRTRGGYMHAPGGESYYAAIWANDQAEYVNPFFPFLGYDKGNESALNSFRHFARFMNEEFSPLPSSIIAEGTDIWNGAGDRGDAAMIAYGAARFCLAMADKSIAAELWPLIKWCLSYCERKLNSDGVVRSDTDELEGRFPAGNANLCTSSLYYDALVSASHLSGICEPQLSGRYRKQAERLKKAIEKYFGADIAGYHTYRYYKENELLRSWICIPLTCGITDRAEGTLKALFGPELWQKDGILTEQGSSTYWDRATLYALRAAFCASEPDAAVQKLSYYSHRRLLEQHVPYAIEAWPEGSQRQLAAESGLYCRIITEGIFGIRPVGFDSFIIRPSIPQSWNEVSLKKIHAFGRTFDISVRNEGENRLTVSINCPSGQKTFRVKNGSSIKIKL